jgi:hypothetical protein
MITTQNIRKPQESEPGDTEDKHPSQAPLERDSMTKHLTDTMLSVQRFVADGNRARSAVADADAAKAQREDKTLPAPTSGQGGAA